MREAQRPLAVVTGASSRLGRELAKLCASHGFDLIAAADDPALALMADEVRAMGVNVDTVPGDLGTVQGVDRLYARVCADGRPVSVLVANAGHEFGRTFLDQDFAEVKAVIDTNIIGTIYLIQKVGRDMRNEGEGRILITGSIPGFIPGSFHAVYNGSKAFVDSFAAGVRNELKASGVSVTCLTPGPGETPFFQGTDRIDSRARNAVQLAPADAAKAGFDAMMRGEAQVAQGVNNNLASAVVPVVQCPRTEPSPEADREPVAAGTAKP